MSSYFDKAEREVADCRSLPEAEFVEAVRKIENRVVEECLLCATDREFPEDLRERIKRHIALLTLGYKNLNPMEKAVSYLKAVKRSELIAELHEDFHEVARRRIKTRFGIMFDSPSSILKDRERHDNPKPDDPEE